MAHKNYFVTATEQKYELDKEQYIIYRKLSEGQRQRYQDSTASQLKVNQNTNEISVPLSTGKDRNNLLKASICGWKLFDEKDAEIPFNDKTLDDFVENIDPSVIDALERKIRTLNTWLLNNVTVEQIDEQIANLEEAKKELEKRDAKKAN
jgi:methyl coenzyme M reductase alpha subunit